MEFNLFQPTKNGDWNFEVWQMGTGVCLKSLQKCVPQHPMGQKITFHSSMSILYPSFSDRPEQQKKTHRDLQWIRMNKNE
jgi:hypothetical protein